MRRSYSIMHDGPGSTYNIMLDVPTSQTHSLAIPSSIVVDVLIALYHVEPTS